MKKKTFVVVGIALFALISAVCFYVVKYEKTNLLSTSHISTQAPPQSEQPKITGNENDKEDNAYEFFFNDTSSKKRYAYEGTMWGDVILQNTKTEKMTTEEEVKIKADLVITEIAKLIKGKVYEFNFSILNDKVDPKYKEQKHFLWVTRDEIYKLNPPDNFDKRNLIVNGVFDDLGYVKMLEKNNQLPNEDKSLIRCSKNNMNFKDSSNPVVETEISVKNSICTYIRSHNSGHFEKFVWEVNKGLTEYSWGQGARRAGIKLAVVNTNAIPAKENPKSETTKTNETISSRFDEIFSKLEGEYLNKDYVDLIKENKSSKKAVTDFRTKPRMSGISDYLAIYFSKRQSGSDWSWTTDFHQADGRKIVDLTDTSEKGIYLMGFNISENNRVEKKVKIVEENNRTIEIYIDDVCFVKTVKDNESFVNKVLLVGKYKSEDGKEYVFNEDSFSIWPTEKFKYEVCLDPIFGNIDYIRRTDKKVNNLPVYYGYEIKDNYLFLYNMTDIQGESVILEEKPFLKLTKIE